MTTLFRASLFVALSATASLMAACSSSTELSEGQAKTISPQAQAYIKSHKATRVPLIDFWPSVVQKVRKSFAEKGAAPLEAYRKQHQLQITRDKIAGIPVVIITPPNTTLATASAIGFYTHGGGFVFGTAGEFTALSMTKELGIPVISVDYQLSPEVQFPVGLNESFAVYRKVAEVYADRKIVAFGESAGGNLTLSTLLKARDAGVKMPVAVGLFTPWTDLTGAGDSYKSNDGRDAAIGWDNQLEKMAKAYMGEGNYKDPLASPIYADYSKGFPPSIITTGTRDLFLSNCTRLYWVLRKANVPVQFRIWEGMWHGTEAFPDLPESQEYRSEVANFLKGYLQ